MGASTVLVAGASRGLGREFVNQYLADGWQVIAGVRTAGAERFDDGVRVLKLDVTRKADVDAADAALGDAPLDLLVIVAGQTGTRSQDFAAPDDAEFDAVMRTNVLGPMRLIEALAPRIAAARGTIAVLSSAMGSIGGSQHAGDLIYRTSKAAVNMVVHNAQLQYSPQGLRIVSLHPGWVRTDMGGSNADLSPEDSVAGMRRVIAKLNAEDSGRFFDYQGKALPW